MRHYGKEALAILTMSCIAACGGGGSSLGGAPAPAAALNSSNQAVASQDVVSTSLSLFDSGQIALGAISTNEASIYAVAFAHLDRLPTYIGSIHTNSTALGAFQSASVNCTYGGSIMISGIDADNSGTATTGDSISLAFDSCSEGSGTVSGALGFSIDSLNGTYGAIPSSVSVTMTFGNLGMASTAYSASITGSLTVSGAKSGVNSFTQQISTNSLSTSATYGSATRYRALTNFSASETRTSDATYTYLTSYSVRGTLSSNGFSGIRSVSFETPTFFVRRGTDLYPYAGVLLISGASNSALRLTTISNTQIMEDLDANGDGTYESTSIVNWNTLL